MSERGPHDQDTRTRLDPAEAFGLLAHDTRMAALRALWRADEPLRFSEIAERANISGTDNFNYHLGKLLGHFVRESGDGYALSRAGRHAMTAVLAGDITSRLALGPVGIDAPCPYCGSDIVLAHEADDLRAMCSSCDGTFRGDRPAGDARAPNPSGTITTLPFPPGGMGDRTPVGVLEAALARFVARNQQIADGVCPDCGGPADVSMRACPDHDDEGICAACGSRFAGHRRFNCQSCGRTQGGVLALLALNEPAFHTFFFEQGYNFLDPTWQEVVVALNMSERVHSIDPLDYEAVWAVGDESLLMNVDGERGLATLARDGQS